MTDLLLKELSNFSKGTSHVYIHRLTGLRYSDGVSSLNLSGDKVNPPSDHVVTWVGEHIPESGILLKFTAFSRKQLLISESWLVGWIEELKTDKNTKVTF